MALVSVVGATGRQGLAQVRQLVAAGHQVRALSRNEKPDLGPTNADIETRVIDLPPGEVVIRFEGVAGGIYSLDEHWNGGGRPDQLAGQAIPVYARIALLAQVIIKEKPAAAWWV